MMFIGCILVVLSVHILFNECTGCTSDVLSVYSLISGCTAYTDGVQCVPWAYSVCRGRTVCAIGVRLFTVRDMVFLKSRTK